MSREGSDMQITTLVVDCQQVQRFKEEERRLN